MQGHTVEARPAAQGIGAEPLPAVAERRVYVIDDDSDIRRSLHFGLASVNIVAWPFVCAQDFLDQVATLAPSPILLDVRMPGMNGVELLARLRELNIHWPVIMMSAHGDIPIAVSSIKLGATDFLEKPFAFGELEELIAQADSQLAESMRHEEERAKARAAWDRLTARESQVIELLITGVANKVVAAELDLSVRTVEIHRASAMVKLNVKSLAQVVALRIAMTS
jgi:two-component system response regulator FixJ